MKMTKAKSLSFVGVLLILAVGAGIYFNSPKAPPIDQEKRKVTVEQIRQVRANVEEFKRLAGSVPKAKCVNNPESCEGQDGSFFKEAKDAWGRKLIFSLDPTTNESRIVSYGADGMPGGEGNDADISSDEIE